MTTQTQPTDLIISTKQQTATNPNQLPTAFRQIEQWANSGQWNAVTTAMLGSGFSLNSSDPLKFMVDPFGFVCMQGRLIMPAITGATFTLALTLPKFCTPGTGAIFFNVTNFSVMTAGILANIGGTPSFDVYFAANQASGGDISLSGFRWSTFK